MAQAPACQFYFADFAMDTADLTVEEVGAYMRLLCFQWEHGSVPEDAKRRARIVGVSTRKLAPLWTHLSRFFELENGRFRNPRMEEERDKQAKRRKQLVEAGRKGGLTSASSKTEAMLNPSSSTSVERESLNNSLSSRSSSRAGEVEW